MMNTNKQQGDNDSSSRVDGASPEPTIGKSQSDENNDTLSFQENEEKKESHEATSFEGRNLQIQDVEQDVNTTCEEQHAKDDSSSRNFATHLESLDEVNSLTSQGTRISHDQRVAQTKSWLQQQAAEREQVDQEENETEANGMGPNDFVGTAMLQSRISRESNQDDPDMKQSSLQSQDENVAASSALSPHIHSSPNNRPTHDQRVARKKRLLAQKAASARHHGETGAAIGAASNRSLDAQVEATVLLQHANRNIDNDSIREIEASAAPGDEMAASLLDNYGEIADGSFSVNDRESSIRKDVDGTAAGNGVTAATVPPAASLRSHQTKAGHAPPATDGPQMMDETEAPGAYQIPGRAFGQYPVWGRPNQDRQVPVWASQRPSHENGSSASMDERTANGSSASMEPRPSVTPLSARVVDDEELQNQVRQQILEGTVQADIVDSQENENAFKQLRRRFIIGAVFVAIAVAIIVGLSVGLTRPSNGSDEDLLNATDIPTPSPTFDSAPTLEIVRQRGRINCGVNTQIGFYQIINGTPTGFEMDMCRAVAVSIFGDDVDRVEPVHMEMSERFVSLTNRSTDVLTLRTTHNMDRDVHEKDVEIGFSFSTPFLYDGVGFAGTPPYGDCANRLDPYFDQCRRLRVCVRDGTTHVPIVKSLLPEPRIEIVKDVWRAFVNGTCNAFASERVGLAEKTIRGEPYSYNGSYEIGTNLFSKEPLALVTRDHDPEWSGIIDWVIRSLLAAEYNNLTQQNVRGIVGSAGRDSDVFVRMIETVGNYGEMYERHLDEIVPREEINRINWNGSTGLIYSHPLGRLSTGGPGPDVGGTLERVSISSRLSCGILSFGAAVDEWRGLDTDFCLAVGASALNTMTPNVTITAFESKEEGLAALSNGTVDIMTGLDMHMAGLRLTLSNGSRFSTSPVYYYHPPLGTDTNIRTRTIATIRDDVQWSDFVYWVVSSTFLAEENFMYQNSSSSMPVVNLFGPDYAQMLQNSIAAVGNYGEICSRNNISQVGRNQINKNPFGPQHFSFPL